MMIAAMLAFRSLSFMIPTYSLAILDDCADVVLRRLGAFVRLFGGGGDYQECIRNR